MENIYAENPDLDWWFKDAQVTVQILLKKGLNCKEIDNPFGVLKCMIKVVFSVILEIKRLIEALPKVIISHLSSSKYQKFMKYRLQDKRHVVVDMVKAIRECFQN